MCVTRVLPYCKAQHVEMIHIIYHFDMVNLAVWQDMCHTHQNLVQSNLDYPDLDYPDFSIIRTSLSGPIFAMNIN